MSVSSGISSFPGFRRYFLYALLIKGVLFLAFALPFNRDEQAKTENFVFVYSGDYKGYISPIINLVDKGVYYEYDDIKNINLYASRMPGMLPVFAPLYFLFGLKWGFTLLVILQFLLDALCCVLLAKIAMKIFKDNRAFYVAFYLYAFSSIVSIGTHYAVSELFCTSFAIVAFYFMLYAKNGRSFLLAGLFAAWAVFFRPVTIIIFLFLPLLLIKSETRVSWKWILEQKRALVLMMLPLALAEALWIGRNYMLLNRFIPADICLENFGTPSMQNVFSMVQSMGGDLQSWNEDSEMLWFNSMDDALHKDSVYLNTIPFPDYVEKAGITLADLKAVKALYHQTSDQRDTTEAGKLLDEQIAAKTREISQRFKQQAPFYYYVVAPLRTLSKLLFIKRPYGFSFSQHGILEKAVRLWHFICYYVPLLLFLAAVFWIGKSSGPAVWILCAYALAHMLLYGFILRYTENRYLVPVHPYFVVISFGTLKHFVPRVLDWKMPASAKV